MFLDIAHGPVFILIHNTFRRLDAGTIQGISLSTIDTYSDSSLLLGLVRVEFSS
jgi:hypothetical protein